MPFTASKVAIVTIQEAVDVIVTIQEAGPWLWLLDVS